MGARCAGIVVADGSRQDAPIVHRCARVAKPGSAWCETCSTPDAQVYQRRLRAVLRPAVVRTLDSGKDLDMFDRPVERRRGRPPKNPSAQAPPVVATPAYVPAPAPAPPPPVQEVKPLTPAGVIASAQRLWDPERARVVWSPGGPTDAG